MRSSSVGMTPRGDSATGSRDARAMALVGGGGERESEPREVFTHRGVDRASRGYYHARTWRRSTPTGAPRIICRSARQPAPDLLALQQVPQSAPPACRSSSSRRTGPVRADRSFLRTERADHLSSTLSWRSDGEGFYAVVDCAGRCSLLRATRMMLSPTEPRHSQNTA